MRIRTISVELMDGDMRQFVAEDFGQATGRDALKIAIQRDAAVSRPALCERSMEPAAEADVDGAAEIWQFPDFRKAIEEVTSFWRQRWPL